MKIKGVIEDPLQYSCLENPMDGGSSWAAVHGVAELGTTEQFHFYFHFDALVGKLRFHVLHCCRSVAQLCPTLYDPMDCSRLGFPILHYLPELVQTHIH